MVKEVSKGLGSMPRETLTLLYEAAQAEDRFRDLNVEQEVINKIIDRQFHHELAKLAKRNIDISNALPPKAKEREV